MSAIWRSVRIDERSSKSKSSGSVSKSSSSQSTKKQHAGRLSVWKAGQDVNTQIMSAITFGVEFEFVLMFHEDELRRVLNKYNIDAEIVKDIKVSEHGSLLDTERQINQDNSAYLGRRLWPSWLLQVPADDQTHSEGADRTVACSGGNNFFKRRYGIEPLLIMKEALSMVDPCVNTIAWTEKRRSKDVTLALAGFEGQIYLYKMDPDYSNWTLTNDYTLVSALRSQLQERLQERGFVSPGQANLWDSHGVELISPKFKFSEKETAFSDIRTYLSALKSNLKCDIMKSIWATTHVHIGFDQETKATLSPLFLQHVAYILISYEDHISKCFPRGSSGIEPQEPFSIIKESDSLPGVSEYQDPSDEEIRRDLDTIEKAQKDEIRAEEEYAKLSPRSKKRTDDEKRAEAEAEESEDLAYATRQNEATVRNMEETYTGYGSVNSNARYMAECLGKRLGKAAHQVQWDDIRDAVFSEEDNLPELMQLMQKPAVDLQSEGQRNRGYMVNWCYLYETWTGEQTFKPHKPTLEFRQHPCITDSEELRHWVELLEATMNVAREKAAQTSRYASTSPLDGERNFAEREGSKYPQDGKPLAAVPSYLTDLLQLDAAEAQYWECRYERYKAER